MPDNSKLVNLEFPDGGIDVSGEFQEQPPGTTPEAVNVRGVNPDTLRERGGSRAGLIKYIPGPLFTGADLIQHLNVIVDPTGPALGQNFEVPGADWVEDPNNPNTFVPPGGWGYQGGSLSATSSGRAVLEADADIVAEGETPEDEHTLWGIFIDYGAGFGDLEANPGTNPGSICDDGVSTLSINGTPYVWSNFETKAAFHAVLVAEGFVGEGTTPDQVMDDYDLVDEGPC